MAKQTIKVKKYLDIIEEYKAAAAITPGMLVELTSAGGVQAHSTPAGNAVPMFALEDELQGNGIGDAYAEDDQVQVWIPQRGEIVNAILANGETAVIGSLLASAGDGTLKVHVAESIDESWNASSEIDSQVFGVTVKPLQIVAQAIEAVDMSGSSGADPDGRILVRIV